jgi:hypothetical protein
MIPIPPFIALFFAKYATYIVGGVMLVAVLGTAYKLHNDGIRREALARFNQTQLEQVIENQGRFNALMESVRKAQDESAERLREQNAELERRTEGVNRFLDGLTSSDPASDVLRETIRRLQEGRQP